MTISAGPRTFKNLNSKTADPILMKLTHYACQLNTFPLLNIEILNILSLKNSL